MKVVATLKTSAILERVGCYPYCWFQQTVHAEQECAPFLARHEETILSIPFLTPHPPGLTSTMLSSSLFVGAAECFEIAGERMGGVAVCSGCSSHPFFDMRDGEVPGGVGHSHSLVLSLATDKNMWQSARCIWRVQ